MLNIGNTWSASLQATGAFVPFEGDQPRAIGGEEKFVETALAATGAPTAQTPTAVPLYGQSYGMFYNKALFADGGHRAAGRRLDLGGVRRHRQEADQGHRTATARPTSTGWASPVPRVANNSHAAFIFGRQHGARALRRGRHAAVRLDAEVKAVTSFVNLMGAESVVLPGSAEYTGDAQVAGDLADGQGRHGPPAVRQPRRLRRPRLRRLRRRPGARHRPAARGRRGHPDDGRRHQHQRLHRTARTRTAPCSWSSSSPATEEQVVLNKAYGTLPVVTEAYDDPAFSDDVSGTFATILARLRRPDAAGARGGPDGDARRRSGQDAHRPGRHRRPP